MPAPDAVLYVACCLAGIGAIFYLQAYRHRLAKGCLWWTYTLLIFALGYEAVEAWEFGAPDFPAGRWFLVPSIAVVTLWAAAQDWRDQRRS